MKKFLLFAILLFSTVNYAQKNIAKKVAELQSLKANFRIISVLSPTQNATDGEVEKVVDGATMATLDIAKVNEVTNSQYDAIELKIPYNNQIISVLLYRVNPFIEGFHVDTDKEKNISYQKGVYYRGIIKGDTNSVSSFNFFNGEFNGIISSTDLGNLVIGKMVKPNNQLDYIVYSDAKMKVLNQFECHTKDEGEIQKHSNETNRNVNTDKCVTFYFEIDNNLFLLNNSNTTTTTNWMTSLFNNVQTLFNNDGISTGLKSIFIWTEADPYNGIGTTSGAYLSAFREFRTVFDGDVGHLVGIDAGGLGGVAYLNSICTQNNYAYSDVVLAYSTVPTYSWPVQVITHEFGHSLGSPHTHRCGWNGNNTAIDGCGQQAGYTEGTCAQGPIPSPEEKGTIMSYCHLISGVGISFNNGFGPQPAELIVNTVNSKSCLSVDCINTCINTVADITVTNITPDSALISWSDLGSNSTWQVSVTLFSASPVWTTVSTNSYAVSGLIFNSYYKVRVRPFCENITPPNKEKIFATSTTNFCSNVTFTDTGGVSANYTNNESWIRTMTPNNPGLKLRASFTSFNLESNYDYLYVYNGPDDTYGDLTLGGLTGSTLPNPFNSTASDGSLTFKFYSDEGVVASGWNATITCTGTLGTEDNTYLDFLYYPNPTNGRVSMSCNTQITNVKVYNVEGRLLFEQKKNDLSTTVDISQFASGTYFFKVKIGDVEKNFKVLKL
ncbi:M12 family metallo-peptidase [Flavobacterium sp. RSB2_4_14]|uniref:M12 family metallo-peptidase n=1 Tax=Flavobacterium sp. RSB2_4_14 TaxID=3447665 RepID=UPI003F40823F